MTRPCVSILVPVYNAEKYLKRCLDSLLEQTMPDLEVVLINDGSTDSSKEICEDYAEKDARVHVYSFENAGVSKTRNRALKRANGEYVMFVDSDDFVDKKMLETMVKEAKKRNLDVLQCGFVMDFGPVPFYRNPSGRKDFTTLEAVHHLVREKYLNNYPWGKLYKRECFDHVHFPEHLPGFEDTCTIFKAIVAAKKIGTIPNRFYHYWTHSGSLTNCMDLRTVYLMRYAYKYQEKTLREYFPNEVFNFDPLYYNTDMVIIYTLILFCHRQDDPKFIRYLFQWKNVPFFPLYFLAYYAWLGLAWIKLGSKIFEAPTSEKQAYYQDPFADYDFSAPLQSEESLRAEEEETVSGREALDSPLS